MTRICVKRAGVFLLALLLGGCAVVPNVTHDPDNWACALKTKKLELVIEYGNPCGRVSAEQEAMICAAMMVITTTTSAVISSSIVLVGNTMHWLEKQGKCPDGIVKQLTREHNEPLLKEGGKLLEPEPEVEL